MSKKNKKRIRKICYLDQIYDKGVIDDAQYLAANKFLELAFYAGLHDSTKSSCNYEVSGRGNIEDRLDMKNRYYKLTVLLNSFELAIIERVLVWDVPVNQIPFFSKAPQEAMEIFKDVLNKIVAHYGLNKNH